MNHAERCPICGGCGNRPPMGGRPADSRKCHGCGGKGWATVEDGKSLYPYPLNKIVDSFGDLVKEAMKSPKDSMRFINLDEPLRRDR